MKKWFFQLAMMGVAFIFCSESEATKYYYSQETALSGNTGSYTSLALDGSNNPHISFRREGVGYLHYATKSGGVWTIESVFDGSTSSGVSTSIALSGSDVLVSFSNFTTTDLKYAKRSGGSWTIENVTGTGTGSGEESDSTGFTSSLSVYSSNPSIAYRNSTTTELRMATKSGGSWSYETVDTNGDAGFEPSLTFNNSGDALISYYSNQTNTLNLGTKSGGVWSIETIASIGTANTGDKNTSLRLDSSGNPHISFYDYSAGNLRYATKSGGVWTVETIETTGDTGSFNSLTLDAMGNPIISYRSSTLGLSVARKSGGAWTIDVVTTLNHGAYTSIAMGSNGNIYISSSNNQSSGLLLTTGVSGNTSTGGTGDGGGNAVGNGNDTFITLSDPVASLSGYEITFQDITADGRVVLSAATNPNSFLSDPMVGGIIAETFRNISIQDATFSGNFLVRVPYDPLDIPAGYTESDLRLFHNNGGTIEDITFRIDFAGNYIEGISSSFSDFGVGVNPEPATLLLLGSALLGLLPLKKRMRR